MTKAARLPGVAWRLLWWFLFGILAVYVAVRMGGFALDRAIEGPVGSVQIPNTFATVDHPFHVARAETLWRSTAAGELLRWISQHQGGYPVEFYPLGEAWLEVTIRAASLGSLSAGSAHTVAVIAIFLAPGAAFVALAREDARSPAVGLLALALHVALPGGWYDGGYTELVQWGLVTNVAGAVAAFLMYPALIRFLSSGSGRAGGLAAFLAAAAVYCNPRSLVALLALGCGAWVGAIVSDRQSTFARPSARLALVALAAALLAAPELLALARFRGLYTFVHYSGYDDLAAYAQTTLSSVGWPVAVLAGIGMVAALSARGRLASRSSTVALIIYVLVTAFIAFAPFGADLASQLEPTRLMPLQRLLTLYLAAGAVWAILARFGASLVPRRAWAPPLVTAIVAGAVLLVLTRPLPGPPPDPASPLIPAAGLYPVERTAQPAQLDIEAAVRATDTEAEPGSALLILGSALSWHQQLWAPLWTDRPLYYDNWLWYWHPRHAGTPGYRPLQGHHYPDPERTLDRAYLARHGIGAVIVAGPVRAAAAASPSLRTLRQGIYDAYLVLEPTTTITFGPADAARAGGLNESFWAVAASPGEPVIARLNWYPRWSAFVDRRPVEPKPQEDGSMTVAPGAPVTQAEFRYAVQPLDWVARGLAAAGVLLLIVLAVWQPGADFVRRHWYPPASVGAVRRAPADADSAWHGAKGTKRGSG